MAYLAVAGAVVVVLCIVLVCFVVADPGPGASDVAVAYEDAWDHLDFETLWLLSGDELRDGLTREAFVVAKRDAYRQQAALRGIARRVVVDAVSEGRGFAVVHTRIDLRDGGHAADVLQLAKRGGRWLVVAYELETDGADSDR